MIERYFQRKQQKISLKYIDPSYTIRSTVANATDSIYCDRLGRFAVHAGMAGKTDVVIGRWHGEYTHVPLALACNHQKRLHPECETWASVLESTGQPAEML